MKQLEIRHRITNEVLAKEDADLTNASLRHASLTHASLRHASLRNADLRDADLRGTDLTNASLRGTSLRDADLTHASLRNADLTYADLRGANLTHASLKDADLRDADLRGTIGNNKEIKTLQLGVYITVISKHGISIGCEQHTLEEWKAFTDEDISAMDDGALEWRTTWKDVILRVVEEINDSKSST